MKKTALMLLFFLSFILVISQTTNYPEITKNDVPYLSITKVELSPSTTTILYKYISPSIYNSGGWVCIGKDVHIRDYYSKKVYKLSKVNNIPICPEKHNFKYRGQVLEFSLEFEPLPSSVTKIDIIEDEETKAFNFYGVILSNQNSRTQSTTDSSNNNITDNYNFCDNIKYIPAAKKPPFNNYLAGIKTVVVTAVDLGDAENTSKLRYHLFSSHTVIHKAVNSYLKDLGFKEIIFLKDDSDLIRYTSCENTFITIIFGLDILSKNPYSNFKMVFTNLCNEYYWGFESYQTAQSNVYSIKSVLQSMYNVRKPYFRSSAVLQLRKQQTCWTEGKLKEAFKKYGCKTIEGIYENTAHSASTAKYKVAVREFNNQYHLIYLSGANNPYNWKEGEIKAYLEETATPFYYKAKWVMAGKTTNKDFYVSFERGIMSVVGFQGKKNVYLKLFPTISDDISNPDVSSSGTGFALSKTGHIATNYHVIKNSHSIEVRGINGDFTQSYTAKVILEDKNNDLAIIKIEDSKFVSIENLPYTLKSRTSDVGTSIFVLGYPLRATMGDEIKLTNGIISSKSGFQGDITSYQISAPVQPGNSGGPLFDNFGNIIGIISAKHTGAENASYAVKASYLLNLIDLLSEKIQLQTINALKNKPLTEQVKTLKKFTFIIEVN